MRINWPEWFFGGSIPPAGSDLRCRNGAQGVFLFPGMGTRLEKEKVHNVC